MIRTLIVDDEALARERIRTLLAEHRDIAVVGECGDGAAAVAAVRELRPDLVFLDIQMPELDGFGVIDALEGGPIPAIVFVTAYDEHAIRAFETEALDYLLKPVQPERFAKTLARAVLRSGGQRFVVRLGGRISFVRAEDIDWIDGASNYARLHTGGRPQLVRETLKSIEARLDPARFVRVHRSTIVNADRIATVEPTAHGEYLVTMRDGAKITTSRTYSERLRTVFKGVKKVK